MANFLWICDPDSVRRSELTRAAVALMKGFVDIPVRTLSAGKHTCLVQTNELAPAKLFEQNGRILFEVGNVVPDESEKTDGLLFGKKSSSYPDGYFATIEGDATSLRAAVDKLGTFPLWYWSCEDVVLLTTQLSLIAEHPKFSRCVDQDAFMHSLLFGHSWGNRCLFQGISRIAPGHVLYVDEKGARQELHYEIPHADLVFQSMPELLDAVDAVLRKSIKTELRNEQSTIVTLSGGRDSRLLIGHAVREVRSVTALTVGRRNDGDMRFARQVGRELGVKHVFVDYDLNRSFSNIQQVINATWGAVGIAQPELLQLSELIPNRTRYFVNGYLLDPVLGGTFRLHSWNRKTNARGADVWLSEFNRRGMPIDWMRRCLTTSGLERLENLLSEKRKEYMAAGENDADRSWRYDLANRGRHYLGALTWFYSFWSWPVTPALSKDLLAICSAIPSPFIAKRFLQDELLRRNWPRLAAIPVDRSTDDYAPVAPTLPWLIKNALVRRMPNMLKGQPDSYYSRLLGINTAGWNQMRKMTSAFSLDLFPDDYKSKELQDVLPPAEGFLAGEHAVLTWEWLKEFVCIHQVLQGVLRKKCRQE